MKHFPEIVELINGLAWPLLVAVLIIYYRRPIKRILHYSNKVSIGDFSVEVEKRTKIIGRPDIHAELINLTPESLKFLFSSTPNENDYRHLIVRSHGIHADKVSHYGLPSKEDMKIFYELEKASFIEFNEPLDNFIKFWQTQKLEYSPIGDHLLIDSATDTSRIENMNYHLTKKGLLAIYTVFDTVADLLKTAGKGNGS